MPRGGSRPGAGRKPDPNSKRQQALAAKATKSRPSRSPAQPKAASGLTLPDGSKAPGAPAGWPFGTQAPADQPPASVPDADDGLTDEQRAGLTPLEYMLAVMRSSKAAPAARMTAAVQAAPYVHAKIAPAGKKEGKNEEAKKVASRFAPAAPPKLAAVGGKKV